MPEAEDALLDIAEWIETRNTPESGNRFVANFIDILSGYAHPNTSYALCKNKHLAALKLQCVTIDNWVVAFKFSKKTLTVHYILFGAGLK